MAPAVAALAALAFWGGAAWHPTPPAGLQPGDLARARTQPAVHYYVTSTHTHEWTPHARQLYQGTTIPTYATLWLTPGRERGTYYRVLVCSPSSSCQVTVTPQARAWELARNVQYQIIVDIGQPHINLHPHAVQVVP